MAGLAASPRSPSIMLLDLISRFVDINVVLKRNCADLMNTAKPYILSPLP